MYFIFIVFIGILNSNYGNKQIIIIMMIIVFISIALFIQYLNVIYIKVKYLDNLSVTNGMFNDSNCE